MHYFETGFFYREPAWHTLGNVLQERPASWQEAMIEAGANWKVYMVPVFAKIPENLSINHLYSMAPNHMATVRSTDGAVLGIVSPEYKPIQNEDIFKFAQGITTLKESTIFETAGVLKGGSIVWVLLALEDLDFMVHDDENELHRTFLAVMSSHDGSSAMKAYLTTTRIVCMNTLQLSFNGVSNVYSLRHIGNVEQRAVECRKTLGLSIRWQKETQELIEYLSDVDCEEEVFKGLLEHVFPEPDENASDKTVSVWENKIAKLETLYERTNDESSIGGTRYAALNTVSEYVDYEYPGYSPEGSFARMFNPEIIRVKEDATNYLLNV
jgi:phage/plasmid-like protein (TIGR03299 family)